MRETLSACLVLWSGETGGAETFTAGLAKALRQQGVDARVLFVTRSAGLASQLDDAEVPWKQLGLTTGSRVVLQPQRLARAVRDLGGGVAIVPSIGYLAGTLKLGGYRRPIIAVEHNGVLLDDAAIRRSARLREEMLGLWAVSAQVAVSDALREAILQRPRCAPRVVTIPNGIDAGRFFPAGGERGERLRIGAAGRLVPGKGFASLIEACAPLHAKGLAELTIAGDGPERPRLEAALRQAGMAPERSLPGSVSDMPAFWRSRDVAVVPSASAESFGMVAVEAMGCALPVVASRQPALSEVVEDGVTGTLVPAGEVTGIRAALQRYAERDDARIAHGNAARARVVERFSVDSAASRYVQLISEIRGVSVA